MEYRAERRCETGITHEQSECKLTPTNFKTSFSFFSSCQKNLKQKHIHILV